MSQFMMGDKVRRNHFNDEVEDGNLIAYGDQGSITAISDGSPYDYCVNFESRGRWYILAACIELCEPETQASKEQKVITKIKYLNEKYAKSRTVPAQVVDAKQEEFGASTTSTGYTITGISPTAVRVHNSYIVDANAIRSESARLRGIDASVELYGYRVASILFDELRTE